MTIVRIERVALDTALDPDKNPIAFTVSTGGAPMSQAHTSTPLDLMDRYVAAMQRGEWETGFGFFAEDIVLHIPGRSRFAGSHRGRDAARRYLESAVAVAHEGVEVEVVDRLCSRERVALILLERFHRDGDVVEIRRANVYRVRGEEISEIWIFEANQAEVDALFAHAT
jgi:ketosteroid isomerase-like protein